MNCYYFSQFRYSDAPTTELRDLMTTMTKHHAALLGGVKLEIKAHDTRWGAAVRIESDGPMPPEVAARLESYEMGWFARGVVDSVRVA